MWRSSPAQVNAPGCHVSATSRSLKNPSFRKQVLPYSVSSAGVPYTTIRPGIPLFTNASFSAAAAMQEPTPSRLCPQPCPGPPFPSRFGCGDCCKPSRASYSAKKPMQSPSVPYDARNAVAWLPSPFSIAKPLFFRNWHSASEEKTSWPATSGCSKMAVLKAAASSFLLSIKLIICSFISCIRHRFINFLSQLLHNRDPLWQGTWEPQS